MVNKNSLKFLSFLRSAVDFVVREPTKMAGLVQQNVGLSLREQTQMWVQNGTSLLGVTPKLTRALMFVTKIVLVFVG